MQTVMLIDYDDLRTLFEQSDKGAYLDRLHRDFATTHVVVFRCMDPTSRYYGYHTVIPIGPGHGVKHPEAYAGSMLSHEETGCGVQGLVGYCNIVPHGFDRDPEIIRDDATWWRYRTHWSDTNGPYGPYNEKIGEDSFRPR